MDNWLTRYLPLRSPDDPAAAPVAPVVTADPPAPVATADPPAPVVDPPVTTTDPPAVDPPAPAPDSSVSKRIDQLTAEKYAAIRKTEATAEQLRLAQETLAQLQAAAAPVETPADGSTTTTTQRPQITHAQLQQMARQEAENITFDTKCTDAFHAGKAAFTDFEASLGNLRNMSPIAAPNGTPLIPRTLLDAVFEAGTADGAPKPAEILYALGKDTSEADRVMQLPPIQQAVAVARFAAKVPVKQALGTVRSAAPAPITPTVGNGATITNVRADDEKSLTLPIDQWMKQRQKDLEKKTAA